MRDSNGIRMVNSTGVGINDQFGCGPVILSHRDPHKFFGRVANQLSMQKELGLCEIDAVEWWNSMEFFLPMIFNSTSQNDTTGSTSLNC